MPVSYDCSIWYPVTINIQVASPLRAFQALKQFIHVVFPKYFAPIHSDFRIFKFIGHPLVHTKVKIAQNKNWGLDPFCNIECSPAKFKAFFYRSWQKDNILGIAMTHKIDKSKICLRCASG